MTDTPVTPAHTQTESLTLLQTFPEHAPRTSDPHYALFHQAQKRMKAAGLMKCWIGNADCSLTYPIELHHAQVEFALSNDVDLTLFNKYHDEMHNAVHVANDDEFQSFVESEGNLMPLCKMHHTGILGVHTIHYPGWLTQKFLKAGVPVPEKKVQARAAKSA